MSKIYEKEATAIVLYTAALLRNQVIPICVLRTHVGHAQKALFIESLPRGAPHSYFYRQTCKA